MPVCNLHKADGEPTRDAVRSRRKREVRAVTISVKRMTKREIEVGRRLYPLEEHGRPKTRGECASGARPCPFVSCRYHLFTDVSTTGAIKLNFPDLDVDELRESCVLDVADRGGETLENVGAIINVTRERIRQIEVKAYEKLRAQVTQLPDPGDFEFAERSLPADTFAIDDVESAPCKPAHTPVAEAAQMQAAYDIRQAEAAARGGR